MNINATFFVQLINFYAFYWLLRIFLFKPAVDVIDRENNADAMLSNIIDQQKKSIDIKKREHQRSWYMCREYCKKQMPAILAQTDSIVDDTVVILTGQEPFEQSENSAPLIKHVYIKLEEKIKHVH